ncbi:hypothetical protein ANRL2_04128 [Anaerolineae bacterium]|nr:hypothetical protein ANRL2_04128 [Anaerolineae bacterium]
MQKLSRTETQAMLKDAEDSFPHGACPTCECFLGYLAQLRIDSDPADKDLFTPYKVNRSEMHHCLGCDPCPPGELYAAYMMKKQKTTLIQL